MREDARLDPVEDVPVPRLPPGDALLVPPEKGAGPPLRRGGGPCPGGRNRPEERQGQNQNGRAPSQAQQAAETLQTGRRPPSLTTPAMSAGRTRFWRICARRLPPPPPRRVPSGSRWGRENPPKPSGRRRFSRRLTPSPKPSRKPWRRARGRTMSSLPGPAHPAQRGKGQGRPPGADGDHGAPVRGCSPPLASTATSPGPCRAPP